MKVKYCNSCGTNLEQFYKTGMLGCPDCYDNFRQEIESALANIQGGFVHVGKKPSIDIRDREKLNQYRLLLKEKEVAGLEGRFADMTKINMEIIDLYEELKGKGLV